MPKSLRMTAFALGIVLGGLAGTSWNPSAAASLQEEPQTGSGTSSADAELQSEIQNTLNKEPSLAGRGVRVTVTEQQIELSGSVAHSRDKLAAARIALSYAANKKLVNRITVTGGSGKAPGESAGAPPLPE